MEDWPILFSLYGEGNWLRRQEIAVVLHICPLRLDSKRELIYFMLGIRTLVLFGKGLPH